jgi:hypothetical protein
VKLIISGLILGLLVSCTSIEPINGTYDVDAEYSATNSAKSLISQGMKDVDENLTRNLEQNIKDEGAVVIINYPELQFTRSNPTQIDDSWKINKIGENQFEFYTEIKGERKRVVLNYDPEEESLFWGNYKYIKR